MNTELAGIYVAGLEPAPVPPKPPTWLEILLNRIWNLARRPLVRARVREVAKIAYDIKLRLLASTIASLEASGKSCPTCRINAVNLKAEVFVSTIRRVMLIGCPHHSGVYDEFLLNNRDDFERSEKLSRWINGF